MNDIQKEQTLLQNVLSKKTLCAKVFSRDDIKSEAARVLFETKAVKIDVERPFTFASGIKAPSIATTAVFSAFRNSAALSCPVLCSLSPVPKAM